MEQSFGITPGRFALVPRTRARLVEEGSDPFIFSSRSDYIIEKGAKQYELLARASQKGLDIQFGYPLLMFYDTRAKMHHVAPLFIVRLDAELGKDSLRLRRSEPLPYLGSKAFERLGLRQEEIVALNNEIREIFEKAHGTKLETVLYILQKETKLNCVEAIDPEHLSYAQIIHSYAGAVVYNKALFFASEATSFNFHLLNDLEKLVKRKDVQSTSLGYIEGLSTNQQDQKVTPILPFAFDEYHLMAFRKILSSDLSVVTGPPGTGKSQFIANLIINLFLQKKRVLLVSHTGEAVRVVNERINSDFMGLITQTGKKEIRQDLGRRLADLVERYNMQQAVELAGSTTFADIANNWRALQREVRYIQQTNRLHRTVGRAINLQANLQLQHNVGMRAMVLTLQLQIWVLTKHLLARRSNQTVVDSVRQLKQHHCDISRDYVRNTYLSLIFANDYYGQLQSYIEALQNRKVMNGDSKNDPSDRYVGAALRAMNVWSCTLKSLGASFPLKADLFDYVIFDEASQIDMPSAAAALYRAKRAVIVGDANQLSHIARISTQAETKLAKQHDITDQRFYPALVRYTDTSLFNSAKKALRSPELELKNHYRSNALIANLFSSVFYGGRLNIFEPDNTLPDGVEPGVHWIDVPGVAHTHVSGSRYNSKEVDSVLSLLKRFVPIARQHNLTIGVATPYSKQRDLISDAAAKYFGDDDLTNVRILTVHQFQGSEVDILIFSIVLADRGDGGSDNWFVRNKQILNVAVSRAKQLLLLVGDRDFALHSESKLKDIAGVCSSPESIDNKIPNRPMNVFEHRLLRLLQRITPSSYRLEPQYVIGGRFTLDFALLSPDHAFRTFKLA